MHSTAQRLTQIKMEAQSDSLWRGHYFRPLSICSNAVKASGRARCTFIGRLQKARGGGTTAQCFTAFDGDRAPARSKHGFATSAPADTISLHFD